MGTPYWSSAQSLPADLVALLDPAAHAGPVFIHPVFGLPEEAGWSKVRKQFGLPSRLAYRNPTLTNSDEYQTSLLTSFTVTPDGDTTDCAPLQPTTPESATILGQSLLLTTYSDFGALGLVANFVSPGEVPANRVVAEGPMLVPAASGAAQERTAPYLVTDGRGRFLWLVNQLHHQAFTYIVSTAVA